MPLWLAVVLLLLALGGIALSRRYLRHDRSGYSEQSQKLLVPCTRLQTEKQGSRSIAGIGYVMPSRCQLPNQPAVDRSEDRILTQ